MPPDAVIELITNSLRVRFDWYGFDGDDCFGSFIISIVSGEHSRCYDFGPCVVWGLRKLSRFLASPGQPGVSGGFRHPDIRTYDLSRTEVGIRLTIRFESSQLHEEFVLTDPVVQDRREFLAAYDGDNRHFEWPE